MGWDSGSIRRRSDNLPLPDKLLVCHFENKITILTCRPQAATRSGPLSKQDLIFGRLNAVYICRRMAHMIKENYI